MSDLRICVFCGSSSGVRPDYAELARDIGRALVSRGVGLVYGAGNVGLMGIVADEVLAGGGEVIGVIPERLVAMEVAHQGLTELHVVEDMHSRKALMVERSDAFLTIPGGIGTMDEFFETLTWSYLGYHAKPCGLLNASGYYDPLVGLIDHFIDEGFLAARARDLILIDDGVDALVDRLLERATPGGDFERDAV